MRLIPGKTKVRVELFRGVTLGDIVVGADAVLMLVLVLISNLSWKVGICIGIGVVAVMLVIRLDEQPNYVYLLHILSYFQFHRRFARAYNDDKLYERALAAENDPDKGLPEKKPAPKETASRRRRRLRDEDQAQRRARRVTEKAKKTAEKKAREERRREDKLLRSSKTPESTKAEIRSRREQEESAAREKAEAPLPQEEQETASQREEKPLSKKEKKREEKERKRQRREEDRLLKSREAPEELKAEIRSRRAESGRENMRRLSEQREAAARRLPMNEIIAFTGIRDGYIEYLNKSYYGGVLEIDPVEFRFFSEHRRSNSIENCLGRILRSLHAGYSANVVKLERPIIYDRYLERENEKLDALAAGYENGVLTEEELQSRVEIEYDRIHELQDFQTTGKVIVPFYYLVLYESDKRQLENQLREAEQLLRNGELTVRRLDDRELAVFLKYSNQLDFDERDVENVLPEDLHLWAQPQTVDVKVRRVEVNHIVTHNFRVVHYPTAVDDAWLAEVMSIPGTKVVLKCRPMDRAKAVRNIDRSLQELRGQWSATGVDSRRLELETHIASLQELLTTLQNDAEALLETNVYVTAYDIVATRNNQRIFQPPASELPTMNEMKKNIRRSWQERGFRLNNMEFDQVQAFIGSQVSALDPLTKEGRGIASNTVAACYPWIYAHISDEGGVKLGESDGVPVFIDFFRRDSERVNSNMVIVGKSGSGKSYATKSLLANLAAEDAKIFILDPENEYTELAENLHGQVINVGNAQYGRLNPFHIITALDDDEAGENGPSGSYATHLQFLEEFFRQIMPDCGKDAMEYLNTLIDHMYLMHDVTPKTDLSKLSPRDYPIFDDLYDEVLQEFQASDNPFTRDLLRTLMNYIAKFSSGGRNANIWNGPSTVTTEENFTVFNFQSMLANRNQTIANAQMLLVLKYIDNEIIKNRDYNTKYNAHRKVVVVIDEAHVFIDAKYPIALDFMFQLAKRIRKYNGMQIVVTQNIKDFVGSEELARKSTAIINACQYSFIFSLAPNDIQDLVKLYENAGGINETEQEQIVQAPRGQAFTIMSPTSRSTFQVETAPGITELFEQRHYVSRYFTGPQGAENWEDFVGPSREKHEAAAAGHRRSGQEDPGELFDEPDRVTFREFDEEEFRDIFGPERAEEEQASGGVSFTEEAEDAAPVLPPEPEPAPESGRARSLGTGDQRDDVFAAIATALSRMADAAERGGTAVPAAGAGYEAEPSPEEERTAAADPVLDARLRAMDAEIRRLREENESLRITLSAPENIPEPVPAARELEAEPSDGEFCPEEEGALLSLLDQPEPAPEEQEPPEPDAPEPESEPEEPAPAASADEEDFMHAFISYAEVMMKMTPIERMTANGREVMVITLDELIAEARAQQERRRAGY